MCNTTFLGLEKGMSLNKSYQFLVSSHNTQKFVRWVTWEICERPFLCAAEEPEALQGKSKDRKVSEKKQFLS